MYIFFLLIITKCVCGKLMEIRKFFDHIPFIARHRGIARVSTAPNRMHFIIDTRFFFFLIVAWRVRFRCARTGVRIARRWISSMRFPQTCLQTSCGIDNVLSDDYDAAACGGHSGSFLSALRRVVVRSLFITRRDVTTHNSEGLVRVVIRPRQECRDISRR